MSKKLWLTYLPGKDKQSLLSSLMEQLTKYGFTVDGGFWDDNLEKSGWLAHSGPLKDAGKSEGWLIAGQMEQWDNPSIQYGLSCLTLCIKQAKDTGLAIFALAMGSDISGLDLPTALKEISLLTDTDPAWAAKLLAAIHRPAKAPDTPAPYRITVHANEYLGQWFEVGPAVGEWQGALFGLDEGEITHHGVGPSGFPPERCTLEYPWRGLKLEVAGKSYTAWAVQNKIRADESYYVKITGHPGSLVFGEHPEKGSGEAFIFKLMRPKSGPL